MTDNDPLTGIRERIDKIDADINLVRLQLEMVKRKEGGLKNLTGSAPSMISEPNNVVRIPVTTPRLSPQFSTRPKAIPVNIQAAATAVAK